MLCARGMFCAISNVLQSWSFFPDLCCWQMESCVCAQQQPEVSGCRVAANTALCSFPGLCQWCQTCIQLHFSELCSS